MPPGFLCVELLPCAALHDLYGSAEQDLMGSLKHSHMEYRKILHSLFHHTLNSFFSFCVNHCHCSCASFLLKQSHFSAQCGSYTFYLVDWFALHFKWFSHSHWMSCYYCNSSHFSGLSLSYLFQKVCN